MSCRPHCQCKNNPPGFGQALGIRAGVQPFASDGTYCVPYAYFGNASRRDVHMAAELAGVVVMAPALWWASTQTENPIARYVLRALALAGAAVDLALLLSYISELELERSDSIGALRTTRAYAGDHYGGPFNHASEMSRFQLGYFG